MISVLFPAFLALLPVGIFGLYRVYRKTGSAIPQVISSALFIQLLEKKSRARKRFKPPLRFFIELFIIALITLGAAGLFLEKEVRTARVIIDNSMSMAAQNTSSVPAKSRIELAKEKAIRYVDTFSRDTRIEIWQTSPTFEPLTEKPVTRGHAGQVIESLVVREQSDRLETVFARVNSLPPVTDTYIVTDKRVLQTAERSLVVDSVPIGSRTDNIALLDIQTEGDDAIRVGLQSFALEESSGQVELTRYDNAGEALRIRSSAFTLSPGQSKEIRFSNIDNSHLYKAELKIPNASTNLLTLDDIGWISFQSSKKVVGVAAPRSISELGLDKLDAFQFQEVDKVLDQSLFTISYLSRPPSDGSALVILPPGAELQASTGITSWKRTHPINRYVEFSELIIPYVLPLQTPLWAEDLIKADRGTIAYAGHDGTSKRIVYGFDLLPYEGVKAPVRSVMLLNALNWLADSTLSSSFQPGSSVILPSSISQTISFNGEQARIREEDGKKILSFDKTGFVIAGDRRYVVNYFDREESQLAQKTMKGSVDLRLPQELESESFNTLSSLLVTLTTLLILFDLFFFDRKKIA